MDEEFGLLWEALHDLYDWQSLNEGEPEAWAERELYNERLTAWNAQCEALKKVQAASK